MVLITLRAADEVRAPRFSEAAGGREKKKDEPTTVATKRRTGA